jgi:NAD(P)-dependent dehydrogenase (short-subunit alcohol dehydrogenase family)
MHILHRHRAGRELGAQSRATAVSNTSTNHERGMTMVLEDKVAVVYGAAGAIGAAVAATFAREGATVFATGRVGSDATEEVDALDEEAVDRHLQSVVDRAGRIDISFNAMGVPDAGLLGVPLVDMDAERFARPIADYTRSWLLTARLAARRMIPNGSGVIMTVTALPARRGTTLNGGYGAAQAAKEQLTRDLSAEFAPHGIRVLGLRPHGLPETGTMRGVFEMKGAGMTWEQFLVFLGSTTHPRRVMAVREVAEMAALMASDRASGMTGTSVNLTMGALDD